MTRGVTLNHQSCPLSSPFYLHHLPLPPITLLGQVRIIYCTQSPSLNVVGMAERRDSKSPRILEQGCSPSTRSAFFPNQNQPSPRTPRTRFSTQSDDIFNSATENFFAGHVEDPEEQEILICHREFLPGTSSHAIFEENARMIGGSMTTKQ